MHQILITVPRSEITGKKASICLVDGYFACACGDTVRASSIVPYSAEQQRVVLQDVCMTCGGTTAMRLDLQGVQYDRVVALHRKY